MNTEKHTLVDAQSLAEDWVEEDSVLDSHDWKVETLKLSELLDLRLSSCDTSFPTDQPMFLNDWKDWFQEELSFRPSWGWMLDPEVFDPGNEVQEIVLSFHEDDKGKYLVVWDGHHRIAAALTRGISSMTVIVGRQKKS